MSQERLLLEPGTLWKIIQERTDHALRCGALQPISTEYEFIEEGGISFFVRVLSNLERKDEAGKKQKKNAAGSGTPINPFLPYEEDLFVANISPTHVALLNKFNVVDYHLLIVTRAYEDQEILLTPEDFEAIRVCFDEYEGLAFYNGGKVAGASQQHKHLQYVPLPLAPRGPKIPIEPLLASAQLQGSQGTAAALPFVNAYVRLSPHLMQSPMKAVETMLKHYYTMLAAVGLLKEFPKRETRQSAPYNLLITRQWMLLVPRSVEYYEAISVNSLGFAGALLVRNEVQINMLKDRGPMALLKNVSVPLSR